MMNTYNLTDRHNIVCMKWGTFYGARDGNRLYRMLHAHMSQPFRLVCFTDDGEGIIPDVETCPLPPFSSAHLQTMGTYRKKTLCRTDLALFTPGERFLFLDLDVVIMHDLTDMFAFEPEKDFIRSYLKIVLTAKKPQKSAQTRENSPDKVPIGSVTSVYFSSMRKIAPQSICVYNGETLGHLVFLVFSCFCDAAQPS